VIRVLLADDHAVVRSGLSQLLATVEDMEVVGTASDGAEAVSLALEERPDVTLMDLSMPNMDGIEAIGHVRAQNPDARIVVLTSFSDRERILDALDAGAVGYLLKDAEPDELIRGVRAAAAGEAPLAPKAASAVLTARTEQRPAAELTPREREVLAALARGKANKQIARDLGISEKTVKAHLTRVFEAIGVSDRTAAALWAQRHGLE
jgi:DNA-binding NarL/FixJ family response regulator